MVIHRASGCRLIVENRPGAGAIIAIDAVAMMAPEGHTLLMTTSGTVWQNRVLYNKLPHNLDKGLTPVVFHRLGPLVIGIGEKVPAANLQAVIAWARQNPCSMGTYAPDSVPHRVADPQPH